MKTIYPVNRLRSFCLPRQLKGSFYTGNALTDANMHRKSTSVWSNTQQKKVLKSFMKQAGIWFRFSFSFRFFFYTRSVISGMKIKELVINDLQLSIFNKRCKYTLSLTLSWHRYLSRLRPEKLTVNVFSNRALPLFFLYKRSLSPWDVSTIL